MHCVNDGTGWQRDGGRVHTSIALPLDAQALYFFSRGRQSRGTFVVRQDDREYSRDKVLIDVAAVHSTPSFLSLVNVCSLQRRVNEYGIGIFVSICASL